MLPSFMSPTRIQSWGRYIKNVTSYLLLITFYQCNILQLHTVADPEGGTGGTCHPPIS